MLHLALFLSRATPLKRWEQLGILHRELAVYRELSGWLSGFSIVTPGGEEEAAYREVIPGVQILYNRWKLPPNLYSLLSPCLHASALKRATLFKSNQLDGAWSAILAGKFFRKPAIIRVGYLWAQTHRLAGNRGIKTRLIEGLQNFSLTQADAIITTTTVIRAHLSQAYPSSAQKILIIPNAVDTDLFRPIEGMERVPNRICFVGRLSGLKNLPILIDALASISEAQLVLIGEGEEKQNLVALALSRRVEAHFLGQLPNQQIPFEISASQLFVLPSSVEGHPKALLEAMSCGLAVIGTDVEGIRELIAHGKTGWLTPPTADDLRNAIQFLLANPALRAELGKNARQFVLENFSLERVTQLEKQALEQTLEHFYREKHGRARAD